MESSCVSNRALLTSIVKIVLFLTMLVKVGSPPGQHALSCAISAVNVHSNVHTREKKWPGERTNGGLSAGYNGRRRATKLTACIPTAFKKKPLPPRIERAGS